MYDKKNIESAAEDLLRELLRAGIIEPGTSQEEMRRKEILAKHRYSVWEDAHGNWHTYVPDGRGGRKQKRYTTKKALEDAIIKAYTSGNTFSDRFDVWVERQKEYGNSPNTIARYESDYRRFFAGTDFEKKNVAGITPDDIRIFLVGVTKSGNVTRKALKELFGYINGVFEKCITDGVLEKNPCVRVDIKLVAKKCPDREPKSAAEKTLTPEEMEILGRKLRKKETPVHLAAELSLYTGMRVGEIAGLDWADVDMDNRVIIVRHSEKYDRLKKEYYIDSTKTGSSRVIPMTDGAFDLFVRARNFQKTQNLPAVGAVFRNGEERVHCRTISDCVRNMTMYDKKNFSGTKCTHAVRRTVNSNMRASGVTTPVASAILGHSNRVNEGHYTYDVTEMARKRAFLEAAVPGAGAPDGT